MSKIRDCPDQGHCRNENLIERLQERIKELEKALFFYADGRNYYAVNEFDISDVMADQGDRANEVLSSKQEKK